MGTADVIPGVSGGTVALIVGIYERLIESIRLLASSATTLLRGSREGSAAAFRSVEWRLVLPLGVGIVTAVGIGSLIIPGLLERYPTQMLSVFFGLIAGSLIVPWRRVDRTGRRTLLIAAVAAIIAAILVGLPPMAVVEPSLPIVFVCAAVAICAMILPGVSGAFLLLVLGVYEATLHALSGLELDYVAVFVAGAVIGLGAFSKLLSWLLRVHHSTTMAALVGLMAGSLRALWPWQTETRGLLAPPADIAQVAIAIGLAIAGFVTVRALVRFGDEAEVETQPTAR